MWCTTECWECEDRKCEHYISKTELYFENQKKGKEIERLNNIINELDKFMDKDYEYYEKYGYAEQGHAMGQIRRIKNKLQELKGVDKE